MKTGDIVMKRNPPKHLKGIVGIVVDTTEHIQAGGSITMVSVAWPGCAPFVTDSSSLEVVNEGR